MLIVLKINLHLSNAAQFYLPESDYADTVAE